MRDRFLIPGLAVVGFAVTMGITGWPHIGPLPWHHAALQPQVAAPNTQVPAVRPAAPPVAAATPVSPVEDAPAPTSDADSEAAAPLPTLPDPAALPSYQEDQDARNADALRSARSR